MSVKVTKKRVETPFGEVSLFTLMNGRGASVELSSLGAGVLAVNVPDASGKIENVCLSYAAPASYMADGPCLGKVPGRYANRIAGGRLAVGGKSYQLAINNGPNALHGGPTGFQNHIWEAEEIPGGVRFTLHSPDGDEHYPGNLTATAEYTWNDADELTLRLSAETDVIFLEKQKNVTKIYPIVWVREIETLYYETACGSGTIAAFTYLYNKENINQTSILQPSGYYLDVEKIDNSIIICGPVIEE